MAEDPEGEAGAAARTALLAAKEEPAAAAHSLLMVLGKSLFAALPIAGIVIGEWPHGQALPGAAASSACPVARERQTNPPWTQRRRGVWVACSQRGKRRRDSRGGSVWARALCPARGRRGSGLAICIAMNACCGAGGAGVLPPGGPGAVYLGQCPHQPLIPIYLVVLGAAVLFLMFLSCVPCGDGTDQRSSLTRHLRALCLLFLCGWFMAGNVWVYTIYPPDYETPEQPRFCQRTLFLFAFGITTAVHVVLGVALLLSLCILVGIFVFDAILPYGGHGSRGGP